MLGTVLDTADFVHWTWARGALEVSPRPHISRLYVVLTNSSQDEMKHQVTDTLIHRHSNQPAVSMGNYYPWCCQLESSPQKFWSNDLRNLSPACLLWLLVNPQISAFRILAKKANKHKQCVCIVSLISLLLRTGHLFYLILSVFHSANLNKVRCIKLGNLLFHKPVSSQSDF